MKKISLLIFTACISLFISAQGPLDSLTVDENDGSIKYEKVIEMQGQKDELYVKALLWANDAFASVKDAIQTRDKEAGIITIKGIATYKYNFAYDKKKQVVVESNQTTEKAEFSMKIFLKDNKAKIVVSDIILKYPGTMSFMDVRFTKLAIANARALLAGKISDQAAGQTALSKYQGVNDVIGSLISGLITVFNKKSEADF